MPTTESKREYLQRWRAAHQEEMKEYFRLRYQAHKSECSAKSRAWYLKNREAVLLRVKQSYATNPGPTIKRARAWDKAHSEVKRKRNSEWAKANPEKKREGCKLHRQRHPEFHHERCKSWRKANPIKVRTHTANRRARIQGNGGSHTAEDIGSLYAKQGALCAACRCDISHEYQVDHIMPLAKGGSNGPENLQLLCRKCNQSKHAKHPADWKKEL